MPFTYEQLQELPSPFYRVSAKALIFDEQGRLLLSVHKDGDFEIPGGGWEHDETFKECLEREVQEELGVRVASISPVLFVFHSQNRHGVPMLRVVVRAEIDSFDFKPGDDMVDTRFVTKEELLRLTPFDPADVGIQNYVDQIWPPAVAQGA